LTRPRLDGYSRSRSRNESRTLSLTPGLPAGRAAASVLGLRNVSHR
jgi:hypothetical protein